MKTILNRSHLASKTIRQLKAMASGKGISKARYGKPWSAICKAELVQALSDYHRVVNSAPKTRHWTTTQETPRISTTRADGHLCGLHWVQASRKRIDLGAALLER